MTKEARILKAAANRLLLSIRHLKFLGHSSFVLWIFCAASASAFAADSQRTNDSFPVLIQVDASQAKGELHPIWRFFGADEPNYATMKNGKKLISELGVLGATG